MSQALEMSYKGSGGSSSNSNGTGLGGSLGKGNRLAKLPGKDARSLSQDKQNRLEQILNNKKDQTRLVKGGKQNIQLPSLQNKSFKNDSNLNDSISQQQKKNPFLNRRQTNNSDDEQLITERKSEVIGGKNAKNTSDLKNNSQLNRNMSQSQLTQGGNKNIESDQKEVDLKVQSGENSQLFMENSSISQSFNNSITKNATQSNQYQSSNMGQREQVEKPKITMNLMDVSFQEQNLTSILESLNTNQNASLFCDDWWDVTETSTSTQLLVATQVIKDIHLKQAILKSQKYETISIGVIQFYHLLANDQLNAEQKHQVNNSLKNMMFFTHQNFLILIQIIMSRMMNKTQAKSLNQWAQTLQKTLDTRMLKKIKTKGEAVQLLKVHMQNSENILRNMCRQNSKKKFFMMIGDWLNAISTVPNEKLREVLYNIEAFRPDALNIAPVEARPTGKGTLASKAISSSTKTSGSSSLVSGGGSSLTGKNPFAILKASAIASTQQAQFPNNFANLPKCSPPFLPALEGDAKNTTYTLVLDLDETLIHNVEYGADSYFLVRPGCVYFIELMAKFYEIVIFTAALQDYADQVIDQIDVNQNIKYRLYRQHTSQNGPFLVKDLSLLGRDMNRTIIIDNISDNFILQPDNGIFCSTWYDDMSDNFLEEVSPLLIELVEKKIPDVKKGLRTYRDQILRQISNGGSTNGNTPQLLFE